MSDWKLGYTDEEIAEAEKLWHAECVEAYKHGYSGDFGFSFSFTMQTYTPQMWLCYFKRPPTGDVSR